MIMTEKPKNNQTKRIYELKKYIDRLFEAYDKGHNSLICHRCMRILMCLNHMLLQLIRMYEFSSTKNKHDRLIYQ